MFSKWFFEGGLFLKPLRYSAKALPARGLAHSQLQTAAASDAASNVEWIQHNSTSCTPHPIPCSMDSTVGIDKKTADLRHTVLNRGPNGSSVSRQVIQGIPTYPKASHPSRLSTIQKKYRITGGPKMMRRSLNFHPPSSPVSQNPGTPFTSP